MRPGAACGHRGHAGRSLPASEPAAEGADSAGAQQAAQPSLRWEQEVQSSKRQRGRQHPIVLVLEIKRGPLRTSFPRRAYLPQARPPPVRQPLIQALQRLHSGHRWLAHGSLCRHGCTLPRSGATAACRNPAVPLASKANPPPAKPRWGQSRGGPLSPPARLGPEGRAGRHQGSRDSDPPRGQRNETGHARQQRDSALHSHTSPKGVTGQHLA